MNRIKKSSFILIFFLTVALAVTFLYINKNTGYALDEKATGTKLELNPTVEYYPADGTNCPSTILDNPNLKVTKSAYDSIDGTRQNTLTVHYYEEGTTTKLAPDDVSTGNTRETYTTSAKNITGYLNTNTPANATGTFAYEDIEVIYYYTPLRTITITKEINTSTINLQHGNPTFIFKLAKSTGETYYKEVVFDNTTTSSKTVVFDNLMPGTYTVSELSSYRYGTTNISNATNGTISNDTIVYDLTTTRTGAGTFVNIKTLNKDLSHNAIIVNTITKK